ncbi:MAG: PEGA domain-containing protein [Myxococcales bacterium]|nr:PEGA domain-containing protein [Polyangiaceae bacterium]MDW8248996.1 PEGA domain-containing protein [Myxococcales bacterium]
MCTHPSCPALVKTDCIPWLDEVKRQIPGVTVELHAEGLAPTEARVILDGKAIFPGNLVEVDPGEHKVQVEAEGYEVFRRTLQVKEGKQGRVIATLLRKEASPPSAPSRSRTAPLV